MPWLRLFVLMFAVVLAVPVLPAPAAEAASLKDQIDAAKQRQAALSKSIAKSERLVAELQQDQKDTAADINRTRADIDRLSTDLQSTRERIAKVRARIRKIEAKHARLVEEQRQTDFTLGLLEEELANGEADLKARRQAMGLRFAEAYRTNETGMVEQIFLADSFSDVLTDTSAYLSYGEQDAQLAAQITQDQQALDTLRLLTTSTRLQTDQLRRATEDTWDQVVGLKKELKKAERQMKKLKERKKKALQRQRAAFAAIIANKKAAANAAAAMRSTKARIQSKINSLMASAQSRASQSFGVKAGSGGGHFVWPASGNISQGYGCTSITFYPPGGGCAHFHDGIDINGIAGSSIKAAAGGVVVYAGRNPYEGNSGAIIVIIAHGGGVSTLYAHLSSVTVGAGQTVNKGSTIGRMGATGYTTGVHLHFEVWSGDWNPVNPYAYL
ncbi:MAG: peptidoglycan DD-metalloendopeptidase family protein [Candidatus Limnocylindrales bacterium]